MAKNKTAKTEAAVKENANQTTETVNAEVVVKAEAPVAEQVKAEPAIKVEVVTETAGAPVAEQAKAEIPVVEKVAEAVKAEAAKAEATVTEAAGQVASFVKVQLEQAQRQFGQFETEAQKALQSLVSRGRESSREMLQRLNVNELRENPKVQELEKKATWVGGEVRQRLGVLQSRMVKVVGGVASQSQVEAINRELDRLTRKIDSLVSPRKAEQPQPPPPQQQSQQEAPKA